MNQREYIESKKHLIPDLTGNSLEAFNLVQNIMTCNAKLANTTSMRTEADIDAIIVMRQEFVDKLKTIILPIRKPLHSGDAKCSCWQCQGYYR